MSVGRLLLLLLLHLLKRLMLLLLVLMLQRVLFWMSHPTFRSWRKFAKSSLFYPMRQNAPSPDGLLLYRLLLLLLLLLILLVRLLVLLLLLQPLLLEFWGLFGCC